MKRFLMLFTFVATPLIGATAGPVVPISLDAADLENGARYDFAVSAHYVFLDPKVGRVDERTLADGFAAPQMFRGTFTAPLTPGTMPAPVAFRFASQPPPPPGMWATIVFKLDITITPSAQSARPPKKRQRIYGGPKMGSGKGIEPHCLQVRGPIASGSFYLGVSTCEQTVPAPPQKSH